MSTAVAGLSPVRHVLANGAVILAQDTSTHPAVTLQVAVPAGSLHDPVDRPGLAHFVSRVIDRGTATRSADELAEAFDSRGVTLSASVARHLLSLSCTCLSEDLAAVLELVADAVRHPTFPAQEVETRRAEIVTAIRQDEDSPAVVAVEHLIELLYPNGHPYGTRVRGSVSSVEAISHGELAEYHRRRFFPAGLTVTIVGDVRPARAVALAESSFGDWAAPPGERVEPPPVVRPASRRELVIPMIGKAQADIAYGFIGVRRCDPDYHALTLMNNVLGQYGLGGRLGDSIRERQGMAYYAFSSFDGNAAEGPLLIRAGVSAANVARTVASIDAEVSSMATDGVTAAELADAKRYLVGSMPRMLETNGGIASFLQTAEFFGLGLDYDRRLPGLLDAVTLDEVHAAARRVLSAAAAAVVVAGPCEPAVLVSSPAS